MKTMTRFFSLAALLLAAAGFSACSSDSNTVIDQPEVTPAPKTYSVSIDAAKGDDGSISRTLSLDGDNNLTSAWAEGEKVTVYNTTKGKALEGELTAQAAGANTTLAGTLTGDIAAGDQLLLKFCSNSYNSQNGTLAYISANCDYATATVKVDKVTDSAFFVAGAANFVNHQAIIKFTLMDKGNSNEPINPSAFTISDGTSTVTLSSIPATTYTTNGNGVLYVAFPAAGEAKTITLTATVGSNTYTYEKADITFTNSEFWTIPVKMSVALPDGVISGKFTINSNGDQVYFSKGNLKYNGSAWSFFDNQYDYFTTHDGTNWDKFGWSTSTTNYGVSTAVASETYSGNFVDWGATMGDGWRTLTKDEWTYLFNTRASGSTVFGTENARYVKATINTDGTSVYGVILFPDGVTIANTEVTTAGTVNGTNAWGTQCTTAQWTALESKGCVFLPTAGMREGSSVTTTGTYGVLGYYWTSTAYNSSRAYLLSFYWYTLAPAAYNPRYIGYAVRLVRPVE